MEFQFITGEYESDGSIKLWLRASDNFKFFVNVVGFKPYGYIPISTNIDNNYFVLAEQRTNPVTKKPFIDRFNNHYKRVITRTPTDVPKLKKLTQNTMECDVLFVTRMLIDLGLYHGISIDISPFNNEPVHFSQLKPCDFKHNPIVLIIDIEQNYPLSKHINCVTIWDSRFQTYLTFVLIHMDSNIKERSWYNMKEDHKIAWFKNEKVMLKTIHNYIFELAPDLIAGYNVDFDIDNTKERMEELGLEWEIDGFMRFDVLKFYRRKRGKSLGDKLKTVIVEEGFRKSEELEATEYDPQMWLDFPNSFILVDYNYDDVLFCNLLINKYNLINTYWGLKNRAGVDDINTTLHYSIPISTLLLRIAHNKLLLPTITDIKDDETAEGAIVLEPEIGVFTDIAVYDLSMFYSSTIILGNFSPEYEGLTTEERLKQPPGIIVQLCMILQEDRKQIQSLMEEFRKDHDITLDPIYKQMEIDSFTAKTYLNAVYGQLLFKRSRVYCRKIAEEMLGWTRKTILEIVKFSELQGFKAVYGDSDSIFLQILHELASSFVEQLNSMLEKFALEQNFKPLWSLKYEYYADKVAFFRKKGEDRGAKKNYVARIIEKDGKKIDPPQLLVKGVAASRGDQAKITKDIQRKAFNQLFDNTLDTFILEVKQLVKSIRHNHIDIDDLAINMNLGKDPKDYELVSEDGKKREGPDYARGAKYANKYLEEDIKKGTRVKMVFINEIQRKPATDVICYTMKSTLPLIKINYEKMIERTIQKKIEQVLEVGGYSWGNIIYKHTLDKFL